MKSLDYISKVGSMALILGGITFSGCSRAGIEKFADEHIGYEEGLGVGIKITFGNKFGPKQRFVLEDYDPNIILEEWFDYNR
jgi:hypothetical protein